MAASDKVSNRLLAVIATVLVIAGLRAGFAVAMPLAAAAVVVAAVWPIKPWLDHALPSKVSYLGTILFVLLIAVGFIAAIYFSIAQMVQAFVQNQELFNRMYASLTARAAEWGFQGFDGERSYARVITFGQTVLSNAYTVLVYLGFIAILVIFGLPEVPALRGKLHRVLAASDRRELIDTADDIAAKIRRYLAVTAVTSLITGVASALWAVAVGLELALVWGVLNFLLNFIPIIGNIVGIVPPTLYAAMQFQSLTMSLVAFLGFAVLQLTISNFVNPALLGRSLSLSPFAVVVALAFWGGVWGIAGAIIAVPLTVALVTISAHFAETAWIARLLSSRE